MVCVGFVYFLHQINFCFSCMCLSCLWKFKRGNSDLQTASLAETVSLGNANDRVFAGNVINCRCSFPFCYTVAARLLSCIARGLTASQFAFPAFPSLAAWTGFPPIAPLLVSFLSSSKWGQLFIWGDFHVHSVTEMYFGTSWEYRTGNYDINTRCHLHLCPNSSRDR